MALTADHTVDRYCPRFRAAAGHGKENLVSLAPNVVMKLLTLWRVFTAFIKLAFGKGSATSPPRLGHLSPSLGLRYCTVARCTSLWAYVVVILCFGTTVEDRYAAE